jgi:hypothetical protein
MSQKKKAKEKNCSAFVSNLTSLTRVPVMRFETNIIRHEFHATCIHGSRVTLRQ